MFAGRQQQLQAVGAAGLAQYMRQVFLLHVSKKTAFKSMPVDFQHAFGNAEAIFLAVKNQLLKHTPIGGPLTDANVVEYAHKVIASYQLRDVPVASAALVTQGAGAGAMLPAALPPPLEANPSPAVMIELITTQIRSDIYEYLLKTAPKRELRVRAKLLDEVTYSRETDAANPYLDVCTWQLRVLSPRAVAAIERSLTGAGQPASPPSSPPFRELRAPAHTDWAGRRSEAGPRASQRDVSRDRGRSTSSVQTISDAPRMQEALEWAVEITGGTKADVPSARVAPHSGLGALMLARALRERGKHDVTHHKIAALCPGFYTVPAAGAAADDLSHKNADDMTIATVLLKLYRPIPRGAAAPPPEAPEAPALPPADGDDARVHAVGAEQHAAADQRVVAVRRAAAGAPPARLASPAPRAESPESSKSSSASSAAAAPAARGRGRGARRPGR